MSTGSASFGDVHQYYEPILNFENTIVLLNEFLKLKWNLGFSLYWTFLLISIIDEGVKFGLQISLSRSCIFAFRFDVMHLKDTFFPFVRHILN